MTSAEHELVPLYHQWMDAVRRKDLATLEGILGQEYSYTASGQGRWSRAGWLAMVSRYDIHRFEFREIDVRDYGDVAVALVRYWQEAIVAEAPRSGDFLITDVWVKRDGRWQVVARSSILTTVQDWPGDEGAAGRQA